MGGVIDKYFFFNWVGLLDNSNAKLYFIRLINYELIENYHILYKSKYFLHTAFLVLFNARHQ